MTIESLEDLKNVEKIAKKLVNLGIMEKEALFFAIECREWQIKLGVIHLNLILPNGQCTYTKESCDVPAFCTCDGNGGGFIETISDSGRMITKVSCYNPDWARSKFERI